MHYDNVFEIFIAVVFAMSTQLGVLGPKSQYLVIPFCLDGGELLPDFYLRFFAIRSEIVLMIYQTGGKYTIELSNIKNLQQYMNYFEI